MPRRTGKVPSYCHHKASGQAVVRIDGRDHYLGAYGSAESHTQYERLIAAWRQRNASAAAHQRERARLVEPDLTIAEIIARYRDFAAAYYVRDGAPTKEFTEMRLALRPLRLHYGQTLAREFGPLDDVRPAARWTDDRAAVMPYPHHDASVLLPDRLMFVAANPQRPIQYARGQAGLPDRMVVHNHRSNRHFHFLQPCAHRTLKNPIFADPEACRLLGDVFREAMERWPFTMDAVVLLPDHLLAIWTLPPGDSDYSMRWAWIKKEFTKQWLAAGGSEQSTSASRRKNRRRGVWQRRFWEHTIETDEDYDRHFDYIHWNPSKHGYVTCPKDWPRSSFHRSVKAGVYDPDWGSRPISFEDLENTVGE